MNNFPQSKILYIFVKNLNNINMEFKKCKECQVLLPETSYDFKDKKNNRRGSTCKVCEYIKKKNFTCELPPDKKQCKYCEEIKHKSFFKKDSAKCFDCVEKEKQLKIKKIKPSEKQCSHCKEIFPLSNFYSKGCTKDRVNYMSACKQCSNIRRRDRRKNNPTARYLIKKEMKALEKKEKSRASFYGITQQELDAMILKQDNKCYICGKSGEENVYKKLAIDHCHATNKVRKLLCNHCNATLGMLKEDMKYIQKLIDYIKEHQEE